MTPLKTIALSAAATLLASQTLACEAVHVVNYDSLKGAFEISLNGVFVDAGANVGGTVLLSQGMAEGANTVSVSYKTTNAGAPASFSVHEACRGELADNAPLATAVFDKSGTGEMAFLHEASVAPIFPGAEVTDGTGLKDAVEKLQKAVRNRDVHTVFAMHGPLLQMMEEQGAPLEIINAHVERMLTEGEVSIAEGLEMRPVMDGQAWEVLTADNTPPVLISLEADDGSYGWQSGTRWIFVDGNWSVIEP